MEMEIMLGSTQEFLFQKVYEVQHWVKDIKILLDHWRFNLKIFNKKKFVCVPSYPERGICGAFYSDEIHS